MRFRYAFKNRVAFYWRYFVSKVFCLWLEVKRPKVKMFVYEMLYSLSKFIDRESLLPSPFETDLVETRFGRFRIRPRTVDMSNVSPAFERRDIDYLLGLIKRLRDDRSKVLFLDIGADIGTYTVTVGNRFKDYKDLYIMAFEPAVSSYGLLKENIKLNGLSDKVEAFNLALWSEDGKELEFEFSPSAPGVSRLRPDSQGKSGKVIARTLDSLIADRVNGYNAIVLKLDVEGVETEVIKGAGKILNSGRDIYFLIEDFVNPVVIDYLEDTGAEFVSKLTPYNSWWRKTIPLNWR